MEEQSLLEALRSDDAKYAYTKPRHYFWGKSGEVPSLERLLLGESFTTPPATDFPLENQQELKPMTLATEVSSETQQEPQHNPLDHARIAQDLQLRKAQVDAAVTQLNSGWNPVFLARYRNEVSGGLSEPALRAIVSKMKQGRMLSDRRNTIIRAIETQGNLTEELRLNLFAADSLRRLEDLFLPFKPKRRAASSQVRDKILGVLAEAVWVGDPAVGNLHDTATLLMDPVRGLDSTDRILDGVSSILADMLADQADLRATVRIVLNESGYLKTAKNSRTSDANALDYREFFRFSEPLRQVAAHKIFSIRRGEKSNALEVLIDWNRPAAVRLILDRLPLPEPGQCVGFADFLSNWKPLPAPKPKEPSPEIVASIATLTESTTPVEQAPVLETAGTELGESQPETPLLESTGELTPPDVSASTEAALVATATTDQEAVVPPLETGAEPVVESQILADHPPENPISAFVEDPYSNLSLPKFKLGLPSPEFMSKHPYRAFLERVAERVIHEFMGPSLERETRRELGARSDDYAIGICCRTLRLRLLTPPSPGLRLLAIDPSGRGGCKVAVLDENGDLVEEGMFNAHPPQSRRAEPKHKLEEWIRRHQIEVIVIGNGAGFRHVETVVAELLQELDDRRHGKIKPPEPSLEIHEEAPDSTVLEQAPIEVVEELSAPTEDAKPEVPEENQNQDALEKTIDPEESVFEATTVSEQATAGDETTDHPVPSVELTTLETPSTGEKTVEGVTFVPGTKHSKQGGRKERKTTPFICPSLDHLPPALTSLAFTTIAEVGAAAYGGSTLGREELPNHEAPLRAAINIGRRFIDSLSEMVKVDPQYLVSGVHATEAQGKNLREALEGVLESSVAQVGLDPNKASVAALRYIPSLNAAVARDLVEYRKNIGKFTNRQQLRLVPGMTEDRYLQAVGFLRIADGDNPLDSTWIHPEKYPLAEWILSELKTDSSALRSVSTHQALRKKIEVEGPGIEGKAPAAMPGVNNATVRQVLGELIHGGDDVRQNFTPPLLRHGLLSMESLEVGQEVRGTVLNVVDFGCFVDVGLKDGGLVHISEMANRFVRSPHEMLHVGEVVRVWIRGLDKDKGRVSLTMIRPGADRGPQGPQGGGQGRGRRPGGNRSDGPRPDGQRDRNDQGARPPRREGGHPEQGNRQPGSDRGPDRGPPRGRGPGNAPPRDQRGPVKSLPRGLADLPPRGTSMKQQLGKGKPRAKDPALDATPVGAEVDKTNQSQLVSKPKKEPVKGAAVNLDTLKTGKNMGTFAELAAFLSVPKPDSESETVSPPSEG